jgi:hypothetical protein
MTYRELVERLRGLASEVEITILNSQVVNINDHVAQDDTIFDLIDEKLRDIGDIVDEEAVRDIPEDNFTDAEADADTLRSAGMGTDEDYGYYGEDDRFETADFYTGGDE